VKWEPKGIMQFVEPQRIARLSADGVFAFIEENETGLPIGELVLHAPAKDSAKTKSRPVADRTA
jgi:hypothetical protein